MNSKSLCGTLAGSPTYRTPVVTYLVIYPDGSDTGTEHSRYLDVSSELMEIPNVYHEVMEQLRGAREIDWNRDDERQWVKENSPEVAKQLGFRINKTVR